MDTAKSMLCFIAGAMAGAVATLFLAPDSGENTRAKIKKSAADLTGKAKEKIAEFERLFPGTDISDVKKLDFMLWQER